MANPHPLDPLTPDEIRCAARLARKAMEDISGELRFEIIELLEPPKAAVRRYTPGDAVDRAARVNVYLKDKVGVWQLKISLTQELVLERKHAESACPMIQPEEFMVLEQLVKSDTRFIEACAKRGITDMDLVCVDPWSGGRFGHEDEEGKHISHTFCWVRSHATDNLYAHPVEGLNAVVDIRAMEVLRVDDWGIIPVPNQDYNYDAASQEALRTDLRPIEITQPEGVSFSIKGSELRWHDWSLRLGFNGRESLTLHDIRFKDRPVLYRASLVEMVVPYGSPKNAHFRKNVFDIGEYGLGKLVNSLKLGCDCLGAIQYLDTWVCDINGEPRQCENAICLHEEDDGILWKHLDFRLDKTEVRRARKLVISCIATVGNYEYACYWYLYLDGQIEFEIKATGIINTVGCEPGHPSKYGTEVAPGVEGQIHQHHFCVRLDLSIDGDQNSVLECDTVAEPAGPDNPYGNAFYMRETPVDVEGGRNLSFEHERYWKFINPNRSNALGQPTGYKLHPEKSVTPYADPTSPSGVRMPFVYKQLWLTSYDADERYPGGDFMNQSDGSDGVHTYATKEKNIENADVVAWHVFGLHHLPRPEDFPVQPVVKTGFMLTPVGFFDRNPTLDIPPSDQGNSCHANAKS